MGIINGKEFIDRLNNYKTKYGMMAKKLRVTFLIILHLKE